MKYCTLKEINCVAYGLFYQFVSPPPPPHPPDIMLSPILANPSFPLCYQK